MIKHLSLILIIIFICLCFTDSQAFYFGTAWDESLTDGTPSDAIHLVDEYAAGMRLRNVTISWSEYEPQKDQFSTTYRDRKIEEIRQLRQKGFSIVLRINAFPVPAWYYATYPDAYYRNQYVSDGTKGIPAGEYYPWDATGNDSLVSIWEPHYRGELEAYFSKVFSDLGNNYWAVYLSIGKWGEADFPGSQYESNIPGADGEVWDYYGHTNCYWAYDQHALNARAGIPLIATYLPGIAGSILGEQVVNGGFEDTQYSHTIANWESTIDTYSIGAWQPEIVTGLAPEGSKYLRYSSPPENGEKQYRLRQALVLKPDTDYILSGKIRVESSAVTTTAHMVVSQPIGTYMWQPVASLSSTVTSWVSLTTATFHSVTYTSKAWLDLYITNNSGLATAVVEYDDLSVTDGLVFDKSAAQAFLGWYYQSLVDFINWQIGMLKKYYSGRIILMGGGFMTRAGDMEAEINCDLSGNSKNHFWVTRGFVPEYYLARLTDRENVIVANTGVESTWRGEIWRERDWGDWGIHEPAFDLSPLQTDWSPPHMYAWLADQYGMEKYCENGGWNSAGQLSDAFKQMAEYNYLGIGWYTVQQLFNGACANLSDFAAGIALYGTPGEPEGILEEFDGATGVAPPAWLDDYNAIIRRDGSSAAVITLVSASPTYGNVKSPVYQNLTTTAYAGTVFNTLEIKVKEISSGAYLDVDLQMEQAPYNFYPLFRNLNQAGNYSLDINKVIPSQTLSRFSVKCWINGGNAGDSVIIDFMRLIKGQVLPTATPTATSIATSTVTPVNVMKTFTPTLTSTPFVAANEVMAYPNPARGKVIFAYTVSGEVKVTIDIYQLTGERVAHIEEYKNGGAGQILKTQWDAPDIAPGIYLARIVITDGSGKVVLNRKKKVAIIK